MKAFKYLIAAAVTAAPLLMAAPAAQALTSHQYAAQGHGRYTYSSGRPMHYSHRGWHQRRAWHRNHWRRHWHHRRWR